MALPRPLRNLQVAPGAQPGPVIAGICIEFARLATESSRLHDANSSVHQLRLVAKALRALLRLADEGRPASDLVRLDRTIRTRAGRLAQARDHAVQTDLLQRLTRRQPQAVEAYARAWLAIRQPDPPGDRTRRRIGLQLAAASLRASRLVPERVSPDGIVAALERSLRKTLRQRRRAAETGEPEAFHAWRRWQKRLESQLRLVLPSPGDRTRRRLGRLHELQERLGRLHDLDELELLLSAAPLPKASDRDTHRRLQFEIGRRAARLRSRLLERSRSVLDEDLPVLVRKVRKAWAN